MLFADDNRICPNEAAYYIARSCAAAIDLIAGNDFEYISLDYDFGYGMPTGLDILVWMKEHSKFPKEINIHSTHPFGSDRMRKYIKENFPESISVTQGSAKCY